jgi:hypothetical protein
VIPRLLVFWTDRAEVALRTAGQVGDLLYSRVGSRGGCECGGGLFAFRRKASEVEAAGGKSAGGRVGAAGIWIGVARLGTLLSWHFQLWLKLRELLRDEELPNVP